MSTAMDLLCCVLIDKRLTISMKMNSFFDKHQEKTDKKLFTVCLKFKDNV